MNHKFKTDKVLMTALLIGTIGIVPVLSEQGFAQNPEPNVRSFKDRITDVRLADTSILAPEISDIRTNVLDNAKEIEFSGQTQGWSIIGGHAFESEIHIEGTAVRGDDGVWQVQAEGKMEIGNREVDLSLEGRAHDGHLKLHGIGSLEEQEFRIFLVGKYAPTTVEEEFALGFKGAYVKFSENGFRIPMMQVGQVTVHPLN